MAKGCLWAVGAFALLALGGVLTLAALFVIAAIGFEAGGPVATRDIAAQDANRTPQWSADGRYLVVSLGFHIYRVGVNGDAWSRLPTEGDAGQFSPTLSADGRIAYLDGSEKQARIAIMDSDGKQIKRHLKTDHRGRNGIPQWSPDGRHIAFTTIGSDGQGNLANESIIMDARGSVVSKHIYAFGRGGGTPVWSNDGAKVAFSWLSHQGRYAITVADTDGSSKTILESPIISESGPNQREPRVGLSAVTWSPNDQIVYYVLKQNAASPAVLYSTNLSTMESKFIADLGEQWVEYIQLYPNGGILLYVATKLNGDKFSFQHSIHLVGADGTPLNELFTDPRELSANPGEIQASWSPDGERIAVVHDGYSSSPLFTIAPDGSDVRALITRDIDGNYFPAHAAPVDP